MQLLEAVHEIDGLERIWFGCDLQQKRQFATLIALKNFAWLLAVLELAPKIVACQAMSLLKESSEVGMLSGTQQFF